jgi:hypothetical protein
VIGEVKVALQKFLMLAPAGDRTRSINWMGGRVTPELRSGRRGEEKHLEAEPKCDNYLSAI